MTALSDTHCQSLSVALKNYVLYVLGYLALQEFPSGKVRWRQYGAVPWPLMALASEVSKTHCADSTSYLSLRT